MPNARTVRRFGALAALVGVAALLTACDDPPTTVVTPVGFNCEIESNNFFVPDTTGTLTSNYTTTGPQAAAPGGTLTVKVVPEPFAIDGTSTGDGTVQNLSGLVWRVAIPVGTTLASHTITGWANVGAGTPTSSVSGNAVVVSVPGPIAANTTATLPTVTMNLQVTGAAGRSSTPRSPGRATTRRGCRSTCASPAPRPAPSTPRSRATRARARCCTAPS